MASKSFDLASLRADELQATIPKAVTTRYDRKSGRIVIRLSSKLDLSFSPDDAQGLENAKPSQLEEVAISPSGFGIHFPKLDADLPASIAGGLSRLQKVDSLPIRKTRRSIQKQSQESGLESEGKTRWEGPGNWATP